MAPIFDVQMRWHSTTEGGRSNPFIGRRYTPTARFVGETAQFSVVLEFAEETRANPAKGTLRLLNAGLFDVQRRFRPSVKLEIMEGARVVADCVLENANEMAEAGEHS